MYTVTVLQLYRKNICPQPRDRPASHNFVLCVGEERSKKKERIEANEES